MLNESMIPRPPSLRDIRRDQEEEARRREQVTSARNTSSTTIGAGGKIDVVGGNLTVSEGGDVIAKDGGKVSVEGGGSVEVIDDGEVVVTGQGPAWAYGDLVPVKACLGNRPSYDPWMGVTYTQPGLYFSKGESLGGLDPRIASEDGDEVTVHSASELMQYGPQVGPNIKSDSIMTVSPWSASIGARSWDQSVNYEGRDGLNGLRANAYASFTTFDMSIGMENYEYLGVIPQGTIASIRASLEDRVLRLQGMDGVDIKGPFTVDGQPVGGAVTSVAGRTGAVSLVKGDVGLGNVDNTTDLAKPVSTATQTALNGKSATTHTHAAASTSAAGFMSAADKSKLDGIPAGGTAVAFYIATGSKENFEAGNQAVATPTYQAAGSTSNLGVPANGQITLTSAGIYSIAFSTTLFVDPGMTTNKLATGRSFMDISDSAGTAYARTVIPAGEDQATGNHAGMYLPAGTVIKFNLLQSSNGVAYYRSRIWITKHP